MEPNHILGMICGYYLSRFDQRAYESIGFGTQRATHEALGKSLDVSPASVKNWRDEFDPVHENPREGWSGRKMYPSRLRTLEALGDLTERELLALVLELVGAPQGRSANELVRIINEQDAGRAFGLRGPTGIKAERVFIRYHGEHSQPLPGRLLDRRYDQCGFDFEILTGKESVFVEVKGLAGDQGGISFTDKEWATAKEKGDKFYLALVRQVASNPEIELFQNPASRCQPRLRTYTTIQVSWSVSLGELLETEDAPEN